MTFSNHWKITRGGTRFKGGEDLHLPWTLFKGGATPPGPTRGGGESGILDLRGGKHPTLYAHLCLLLACHVSRKLPSNPYCHAFKSPESDLPHPYIRVWFGKSTWHFAKWSFRSSLGLKSLRMFSNILNIFGLVMSKFSHLSGAYFFKNDMKKFIFSKKFTHETWAKIIKKIISHHFYSMISKLSSIHDPLYHCNSSFHVKKTSTNF